MSAAEAVLDTVLANQVGIYQRLHELGDMLALGIGEIMTRLDIPHQVHHLGPLLSLLLTKAKRRNCSIIATSAPTAISSATSTGSITCSCPAFISIPISSSPCSSPRPTRADIAAAALEAMEEEP